jgi:hypothetical protein
MSPPSQEEAAGPKGCRAADSANRASCCCQTFCISARESGLSASCRAPGPLPAALSTAWSHCCPICKKSCEPGAMRPRVSAAAPGIPTPKGCVPSPWACSWPMAWVH